MSNVEFIPPMINGVSASQVFLPTADASSPSCIFDYLCQQFPHIAAEEWQQRFQDQLIYDAQGNTLQLGSPYQGNVHIFYYRFLAHEIEVPFAHQILHETADLLVVDKPHFLTMSPTGQYVQQTLLVRLKKQTQNANLTPIHRLDRETAGVVLFSKRPETRGIYQQLFAERRVEKTYHAIARYDPNLIFPCTTRLRMEKGQPFYTMRVIDGEPNSETIIELLQQHGAWAKYQLKPQTGKQHQLRVHLNHLHIPIQYDPLYPQVQHKAADDFTQPLQLLAKEISFIDPISEQHMRFCSVFELTL